MQVPKDSRPQLSGLGVVIAHYDQGLPYHAVRQVGPDRYILSDRYTLSGGSQAPKDSGQWR
jgi:hypothetical protein